MPYNSGVLPRCDGISKVILLKICLFLSKMIMLYAFNVLYSACLKERVGLVDSHKNCAQIKGGCASAFGLFRVLTASVPVLKLNLCALPPNDDRFHLPRKVQSIHDILRMERRLGAFEVSHGLVLHVGSSSQGRAHFEVSMIKLQSSFCGRSKE